MAIGKRKPKQQGLFVAATEIVKAASHPFYTKVNEILDRNKVDRRLEYLCKRFYAPTMGRPGLALAARGESRDGAIKVVEPIKHL